MSSPPVSTPAGLLHTGGCLCGACRYRITGPLGPLVACHCNHCRRLSGSAYSLNLRVRDAHLSWHGQPTVYRDRGDAGHEVERWFCPRCGTPLATRSPLLPEHWLLRAGSLDAPPAEPPRWQIWTRSALPWALLPEVQACTEGL